MMTFHRNRWLAALVLGVVVGSCPAQPADHPALTVIGTLKPRDAKGISGSSWSIGGETLDRDFAIYTNYSRYLGALGAKAIRLQAGWAKCEPAPGTYSWGWLDQAIDDARAQGIQPWLELSYGHPLYPGGGGTGLGGGFPSSAEALRAWDKWAAALVTRYQDRVYEWEVWNEPDINKAGTAKVDAYADLYIRTARIIREAQPTGRIYALGLAGDISYARQFLELMQKKQCLELIDAITVHGYPRNPDNTTNIDQLRILVERTGRPIQIRQGETGAPSQYQSGFALSGIEWTETMQAKWDLRRMLAHHIKDVPVNLFTICDLHYRDDSGKVRMNYKGLLATAPDQSVTRPKPAYFAAQNVMSIFDERLQRIRDCSYKTTSLRGLTVAGFRDVKGRTAVVYWFNDAPPDDTQATTPIGLTLPDLKFTDPTLVDLRTGVVHRLAPGCWSASGTGSVFTNLPACDSPLLLADPGLVEIQ
jgi:hypothetical protein